MVQISRRKLENEVLTKLFRLFFNTVGKRNNQEEFQLIINDIFSPVERVMIVKRIAIIYLLLKGINQATIADVLKVSSATISKFSLIVNNNQGIVRYFNKIIRNEKIKGFLEDTFTDLFIPPLRYGSNWKAGWQTKFQKEREKERGI